MTGGGQTDGIFSVGGTPVTVSQGFQLRTGPGAHSNLEVNYPNADGSGMNQFHLGPPDGYSNFMAGSINCGKKGGGQPQDYPNCIYGYATGTLNGQTATVSINFVDCGEPGTSDTRTISIWYGDYFADPSITAQPPEIFAQGTIKHGNNQAHKC